MMRGEHRKLCALEWNLEFSMYLMSNFSMILRFFILKLADNISQFHCIKKGGPCREEDTRGEEEVRKIKRNVQRDVKLQSANQF